MPSSIHWLSNISLKKKLLLIFAIPIFLMLLVSISVYNNTQSMVSDHHWVSHTHKAIARAEELLSISIDMEASQHDYLITNDENFLKPYNYGLDVWANKLQTLSRQVSDNPAQVDRLQVIDNLHNEWLEHAGLDEVSKIRITQERSDSIQVAIDFIKGGTGKHIIQATRTEIARFIAVENELIAIRITQSERSANQTTFVLLFGTLLAVLISAFVAMSASSWLRKRIHLLLEASQLVSVGKFKEGQSNLNLEGNQGGKDELFLLSHGFKSMIESLSKNEQKMRETNTKLEMEREKAEAAVKAKSHFLSTMSHEIRTPMNGVLGLAQIIRDETNEPSTKENIRVILDSGQHLMTILNDILDLSKVAENKLELEEAPFRLSQVLSPVCSSMEPLVNEKNIQFLVENEVPDNIEFTGDCARLRQILFNLGGNAIKFTNIGHVLFHFTLNKETSHLLISVNDTGIGIPKDKQGSIFNSFEQADTSTTRRFGGTGLGLTIVKKLVELMSGDISLKSEEGLGTHILVTLPIRWIERKSSPLTITSPSYKTSIGTNLRVLLIEDNRVNAIVAKGFCEKLGHSVEVAENGRIAIDYIQNNDYDLILMDNHMPEMNGVEATKFIRDKLGIKTLLFAYTADVFREAHDQFIEAGADHVLTKPLQQESFIDALNQFSSRLPLHDQQASKNDVENVVHLQRKSIERLRLTEEELTRSQTLDMLKDDTDSFTELLTNMVTEFEQLIDKLIEQFMSENWEPLSETLHSIKGIALNLGLETLANQALEIESLVNNQQIPKIEQVQKVVNRLQVNIHQGQRLIIENSNVATATMSHSQSAND